MKPLALFIFICSTLFSEIYDFGVVGKQVEIIEENGEDLIARKIKELDIKKINQELNERVLEYSVSHLDLPASTVDSKTEEEDIYLASYDIVDYSTNTIVYKKGDRIPTELTPGTSFSLCFIDGKYKKDIVNKIVKEFGGKEACKYFIDNISQQDFLELYGIEAYPLNEQNLQFKDRYVIENMPTKITRYSNKIKRETLDMKRISLEVAEGR